MLLTDEKLDDTCEEHIARHLDVEPWDNDFISGLSDQVLLYLNDKCYETGFDFHLDNGEGVDNPFTEMMDLLEEEKKNRGIKDGF